MKQWIQAILCIAILGVPATAMVSGRVVDGSGNPVPDAMINYTNIANRLVYVYSNANGAFCIPAPADWNVNDPPMYKSCSVPVMQPAKNWKNYYVFNVELRGSEILFYVGNGGRRITADLFELSGKRICRLLDQTLAEGPYSLNAFAKAGHLISQKLFVVRINDGLNSKSVTLLKTGQSNVTRLVSNASNGLSQNSSRFLTKLAAVDGVRAGKTGYKATTVQINAYTDNVGDVSIAKIDIEKKVDSIVALMTLAEKAGQMIQTANGDANYIKTNFIGSFLKGSSWAAQQSVQNGGLGTRLKIPLTIGTDYVHGGPMVYFPHNVGLGASGDTLLTELSYRICAMCCKVGNNTNFAPCIDVPRNDKNGRVYEGWGENVDVTKHMARAAVRGLQGTDLSSDYTMIATVKHFAGAGGTADGQMRGAASTGTWPVLCRIHLPQFHAAVDAGVASVMTSYNSFVSSATNAGQTNCTEHSVLITDSLKNGWGFDGFVICDWMQVYAPTWAPPIDRVNTAFNAGMDVSMSPQNDLDLLNLIKARAGGTISQARIDDAAKRCVRVKLRMGLFDNPLPNQALSTYFSDPQYRAVARACVRKSIVLLKNTNAALPLSKTAKIAVVGAWADNLGVQCGAWSETGGDAWQGSTTAHGITGGTTILQGLQAGINGAGGGTVTYYANGTGIPNTVDKIVVVVGETPYAEDAGYKGDITLAADQIALVQSVATAAAGKPVITILLTGRPNVLGTIPTNSTALVAAWLPGTEGTGVADVLYGDYNFVGKLNYTWPASNAQEPINDGTMGDANGSGGAPLFAYGTGLTYP